MTNITDRPIWRNYNKIMYNFMYNVTLHLATKINKYDGLKMTEAYRNMKPNITHIKWLCIWAVILTSNIL
jgi:hypothetical protein